MTPGIYEFGPRQSVMAYGGRSVDVEQRWSAHRQALRNDRHHCIHLQRAWNKYGEGVFEFRVLEVIEDPDERIAAEQIWLDIHHANKTCYNIAITAGPAGPLSEEHRRSISKALLGNQNGKGHKHTDEERRRQSAAQMGHEVSPATRQKLRDAATGNQRAKGSKRTDAAKQKISKSLIGRKLSKEHVLAKAASCARPYPAFVHRDTGKIVPAGINLSRLCRERGLADGSMCRVKNGKQSHHKGWILLGNVQIQSEIE